MTQFTVKKLESEYAHRDTVLIPQKYRGGIKPSKCCKLISPVASKIVQVYGKREDDQPNIYMDLRTRELFELQIDSVVDFKLKPVGWLGQFFWTSRHADLTVRMAAQLGIISVILGFLGLALGCVGLWISLHPPH